MRRCADPVIAIATRSFGQASQTFIRNHVRTIAPGRTVLISQDPDGVAALGCPALTGMDSAEPAVADLSPPRGLDRLRTAARARWKAYVAPGLARRDRARVVAFLRAQGATAVLAEFGYTAVDLQRACAEAGVPLYAHFHGYDASARLRRRHVVHEYQRLFRGAAAIIAPSRHVGERLLSIGLPEDKLHVSACGVDAAHFAPSRRAPMRVVAVGRLVEKKAPHLAIEAFARMSDAVRDARLDMIGDGPLMARCARLVAERGLEGRVRLRGYQPPEIVAETMQEASLFIQHSVTAPDGDIEGMPVAILEAMACALPVVVTNHSGAAEAVLDGETGLLTPERDPDAMARAMESLLRDPERAARMGMGGRRRVLECFTHEKTRDRLRRIMGLSPIEESVPT